MEAAPGGRAPVAELHRLDSIANHQATSTPFVLRGAAADWPALSRWVGQEGVDYLCSRHGDVLVDVAVSEGGTFSGDVRKAVSTSMPLRHFLHEMDPESQGEAAEPPCTSSEQDDGDESRTEDCASGGAGSSAGSAGRQALRLYLAQCPMLCAAEGDDPLLPELMADIRMPPCLGQQELCSANLWMCRSHGTRSTLHYDGHHNLLCLVAGEKKLTLYPPDDPELLESLPAVHMPSCNHCSVEGGDGCQVVLRAGDCLFIPEGWFHKVSSEPFTAAVNLWWSGMGSWLAATETSLATSCCSKVSASCPLPASQTPFNGWCAGMSKAYLCRRLFEGLMDECGHRMRAAASEDHHVSKKRKRAAHMSEEGGPEESAGARAPLHGMSKPQCADADVMKQCQALRSMPAEERDATLLQLGAEGGGRLEELVRGMDTLTAEILTRGWESAGSEKQEQQQAFYNQLWAFFPDGGAGAMSLLLEKKEAFSRTVMESVLRRALGYESATRR